MIKKFAVKYVDEETNIVMTHDIGSGKITIEGKGGRDFKFIRSNPVVAMKVGMAIYQLALKAQETEEKDKKLFGWDPKQGS